jgi:agmatinase
MKLVPKSQEFFGLGKSVATRTMVVVGVPWDFTSSYERGTAAAPDVIRRATDGRLYNRFTEQGDDLGELWKVCDHGNVKARQSSPLSTLEDSVHKIVTRHGHANASVIFLGGDHYVTYPCFSSAARIRCERLSLIYFDAHPDIYADYEGSLHSHATVVSRILERTDASTGIVCYVGVRASSRKQEQRVKKHGLTVFTSRAVEVQGGTAIAASIKSVLADIPVYLSIDLDSLDPAYAPGVVHRQPGGLSTRQLFDILQGLGGLRIVAADIVEYSPRHDNGSRATAFTAAVLIKELMGLMAKSP